MAKNKTHVVKEMMTVEKSIYINLTRRVRTLEEDNAKLEAYMKVIQEAARESQTRSRVYSKREDAPKHKSIHRGNGKSVQGGHTRQVLRGAKTVPVGGVQVPVYNSAAYKPRFTKGQSKTESPTTKVVKARDW